MFLNNQVLVKSFMESVNQIDNSQLDINDLNTKDIKNIKLRLTLMLEKTQELFESILDSDEANFVYSPLFNILKKQIHLLNETDIDIKKEQIATYLADSNYINYGTAVLFNIPLQQCFLEVHKANMTKVTSFVGSPIYREDGKLLYDSSYTPPNIKSILDSYTSD